MDWDDLGTFLESGSAELVSKNSNPSHDTRAYIASCGMYGKIPYAELYGDGFKWMMDKAG